MCLFFYLFSSNNKFLRNNLKIFQCHFFCNCIFLKLKVKQILFKYCTDFLLIFNLVHGSLNICSDLKFVCFSLKRQLINNNEN